MGSAVDLKLVVKHIANGTLGENLCRVCLAPLTDCSENVFTSICKEGKEYCVADVLKELCNIKIAECDHYNVCSECYIAASNAYKFYLNAKANEVVLNYYVDELERHSHSFDVPDDIKAESICISLPAVEIEHFDYDIKSNYYSTNGLAQRVWSDANNVQIKTEGAFSSSIINKQIKQENDDNIVVITMNEKGQPSFFEMLPDGSLTKKKYDEECKKAFEAIPKEDHAAKKRKKREPLIARECPRCPIKYRFIAKLKAHMKNEHYATLYVCRICQAITDNADDHEFHLKTHMSPYECDTCNVVFTRREAIIEHIKEHRKQGNGQMLKSNYVCVTCGVIFSDETSLKMHTDLNHYKNYTCYYCGRTYKGVAGLEKHIKKHEMYLKPKTKSKPSEKPPEAADGGGDGGAGSGAESSLTCEVCGRGFRSARSLLWHSRLHANERPFACDICGRAFVSVNRRNQHRVCSHSAPARRCPLCPALFHLRSMVNTHIKKVHLSRHKRRSRAARGAGGAAVPVQELSVALQHRVLDLQRERAMMSEEISQ